MRTERIRRHSASRIPADGSRDVDFHVEACRKQQGDDDRCAAADSGSHEIVDGRLFDVDERLLDADAGDEASDLGRQKLDGASAGVVSSAAFSRVASS